MQLDFLHVNAERSTFRWRFAFLSGVYPKLRPARDRLSFYPVYDLTRASGAE